MSRTVLSSGQGVGGEGVILAEGEIVIGNVRLRGKAGGGGGV